MLRLLLSDRGGAASRRRLRPPALRSLALLPLALAALLLPGCVSHFLIHPRATPEGASEWEEEWTTDGGMRLRTTWVRPAGEGPFPAVLVHPEANHPAWEMRGILRNLARHGYLAVSADYHRDDAGLIPWREEEDPRVVLDRVLARDDVDPARIGAMGYSQGGVYSLLIAAHTGRVGAVVAYYPVTDFELWLEEAQTEGPRGWAFRRFIEPYFRKKSGAGDDDEAFSRFLGRASAYRQAEEIRAPVLLVHGDRDRSADVSESRRLEERLRELGQPVKLVVVEDAGHVFNFRNAAKAKRAWHEATAWLDRWLAAPGPGRSESETEP